MGIFSILIETLVALGWALLLSAAALVVLSLPFIVWVEASRAVLRPMLARLGPLRRPTQFGVTDLACLIAEMSVLGVITANAAALSGSQPAALLLWMLLMLMTVTGWRCAVNWLNRTQVTHLARRAVFQLLVVPTALFFPLLFLTLTLAVLQMLRLLAPLDAAAIAGALCAGGLATGLLLRASRRLADWVAYASPELKQR